MTFITITLLVVIATCVPIVSGTTPAVDVFFPSNDECGKRIPEEGRETCIDCMVSFIGKLPEDEYYIEWLRNDDLISHDDLIQKSYSPHFSVKVIHDTHEKYGGDYEIYRLLISNVTRGDTNTYRCRFEYTLDGFKSTLTRSLELIVRYFPSNSYPLCSGESEFLIDADMVFKCLSDAGEPQVHLNWTYNIKIGDKLVTQIAPGNLIPQNDGTIIYALYTTAIALYDGSTFVCTMSSNFFPDKLRSCSIGPLKILHNPTDAHENPTGITTPQTTHITAEYESSTGDPTTAKYHIATSGVPLTSEHVWKTGSPLTTTTLPTITLARTDIPTKSSSPQSQTYTSDTLGHTTPGSSIKETTHLFTTSTTHTIANRYYTSITMNRNPETPFATKPRGNIEQTTKFFDQTVPGNITSATNGEAGSNILNIWALIIGLSFAIVFFAILLLFVFYRWRQTKEKLKKHGESSHLPSMNYNDLQHRYEINNHAYFHDVSDEIPSYPPGKKMEGQRLHVGPGVMYGANMAPTYPHNERQYHQAPTLQLHGTYPGETPNGMPSVPNGGHSKPNSHTYSELTPPKLPPNRPTSMPHCASPMYDRTSRDPYYYKIQTPSAPALETVEPSQQSIVANILYQSTNETTVMQPYVEINCNGGTHMANEEIYQTVS